MNPIIDIKFETQEFNNLSCNCILKGFILEYKKKKYIISIHHYLPIKKISYNDIELKQLINSYWSEILILEYNLSDFISYKKYHVSLPKLNTQLYFNNIELLVSDIVFFEHPFNSVYIECKIKNDTLIDKIKDILPSLSGQPVFFDKNKKNIIGIFSKFNQSNNTLLFIPIYVVIKNLNKNDNNNAYTISEPITNDTIYHVNLKYNIPINAYFILEGDDSKCLIIDKQKYNYIINNNLTMSNVNSSLYNFRSLILLKKILPRDEFLEIIKQLK